MTKDGVYISRRNFDNNIFKRASMTNHMSSTIAQSTFDVGQAKKFADDGVVYDSEPMDTQTKIFQQQKQLY